MNTNNAIIMWYYSLLSLCISSLFLALFEMKSWVSKTCLQRTGRETGWWLMGQNCLTKQPKMPCNIYSGNCIEPNINCCESNVSCLFGFEADVYICHALSILTLHGQNQTDLNWCHLTPRVLLMCHFKWLHLWMSLSSVCTLNIKRCAKKINTKNPMTPF